MKKKGSKVVQFSTEQLLNLINHNDATKTKEFKKFQEFKSKIKDYDKKKKETNPKIAQLAEEFRHEMKRRGELVEGEINFSNELLEDSKIQDDTEVTGDKNNLNLNKESQQNQRFDHSLKKDLLDSDESLDISKEKVIEEEEMKKELESMHNKYSDVNNLIKEISKSKRSQINKDLKKKIVFQTEKNNNSSSTQESPKDEISSLKEDLITVANNDTSVHQIKSFGPNKEIEKKVSNKKMKESKEKQNEISIKNKEKGVTSGNEEKAVKINKENQRNNLTENQKENSEIIVPKKKIVPSKKDFKEKQYPHIEIKKILKLLSDKLVTQLFNYDSIQLIAALKYIEFKDENILSLITMISVIRRKELKVHEFPEIESTINYLLNKLKSIDETHLVSLIYSISKMHIANELIIKEIINEITTRHEKLNIRNISNFFYSLSVLQLKNPKQFNFDNYFRDLEVEIIKKLLISKKFNLDIDHQSLGNLILAYCKTQNGSVEFYRILEEFIEAKKHSLKNQELSYITYSYSNNKDCTERVLEILYDRILKNILKFNAIELCNVLRAYHRRNMLNSELKIKIIDSFVQKHELVNTLDLSYFYSILAEDPQEVVTEKDNEISKSVAINNDKKELGIAINYKEEIQRFLKYAHLCINNLASNFSGRDLSIIYEKIIFMQEKSPESFEKIKQQTLKLINKNDFKGSDLNIIYSFTKGLKYDGKYDLFNEKIEQHLTKLKYNR